LKLRYNKAVLAELVGMKSKILCVKTANNTCYEWGVVRVRAVKSPRSAKQKGFENAEDRGWTRGLYFKKLELWWKR
jgi:hypothetical protein